MILEKKENFKIKENKENWKRIKLKKIIFQNQTINKKQFSIPLNPFRQSFNHKSFTVFLRYYKYGALECKEEKGGEEYLYVGSYHQKKKRAEGFGKKTKKGNLIFKGSFKKGKEWSGTGLIRIANNTSTSSSALFYYGSLKKSLPHGKGKIFTFSPSSPVSTSSISPSFGSLSSLEVFLSSFNFESHSLTPSSSTFSSLFGENVGNENMIWEGLFKDGKEFSKKFTNFY